MEAVLCSKKRTNDYLWVINEVHVQTLCQRAKLHAGIKPTALCSAFDKENSIEFPLDFLLYLYIFLTLTLH